MNRTPLKIVSVVALLLLLSIPIIDRIDIPEIKDFIIILTVAFIAIVFMYINILVTSNTQYHQGI